MKRRVAPYLSTVWAILLICPILIACAGTGAAAPDPIDALVKDLDATHGMWINGLALDLELPPDTEPEELLAEAVELIGFDQGYITSYRIREVRQVQLDAGFIETYSAALIESNLGTKVFLFRLQSNNRWWGRFYDIDSAKVSPALRAP